MNATVLPMGSYTTPLMTLVRTLTNVPRCLKLTTSAVSKPTPSAGTPLAAMSVSAQLDSTSLLLMASSLHAQTSTNAPTDKPDAAMVRLVWLYLGNKKLINVEILHVSTLPLDTLVPVIKDLLEMVRLAMTSTNVTRRSATMQQTVTRTPFARICPTLKENTNVTAPEDSLEMAHIARTWMSVTFNPPRTTPTTAMPMPHVWTPMVTSSVTVTQGTLGMARIARISTSV
jgi:hypothetical protein